MLCHGRAVYDVGTMGFRRLIFRISFSRKPVSLAAGGVALVVLGVGVALPARAGPLLHEILDARLNGFSSNVFGCPTPGNNGPDQQRCNLWGRAYPDLRPDLVNSPVAPVDGFPVYRGVPDRYAGDAMSTANFGAANSGTDACEAWYYVWVATENPDVGTFVSYYGASSTIVNLSETGNANAADCNTMTVSNPTACFGALSSQSATGSATDTPLGTIESMGGLEPVPVPRVVSASSSAVTMAWDSPGNQTTVNRPSYTGATCPGGATFDDLTETDGPEPIWGTRLYVHLRGMGASPASLAELEGSTVDEDGNLMVLGNDGDGVCYDDISCPSAHLISCSAVMGGMCQANGVDFQPVAQQVTIDLEQLDAELKEDGPVTLDDEVVFNTKVVFRGGGTLSSVASVATPNARLVSLFSSHSHPVAFDEASEGTTGGTDGDTGAQTTGATGFGSTGGQGTTAAGDGSGGESTADGSTISGPGSGSGHGTETGSGGRTDPGGDSGTTGATTASDGTADDGSGSSGGRSTGQTTDSGCGCTAPGSSWSGAALWFVAAIGGRRRRRA